MTVTVDELLTKVVQMDGSDLHLKAEQYPMVRIYGDLYPLEAYGKPLAIPAGSFSEGAGVRFRL